MPLYSIQSIKYVRHRLLFDIQIQHTWVVTYLYDYDSSSSISLHKQLIS